MHCISLRAKHRFFFNLLLFLFISLSGSRKFLLVYKRPSCFKHKVRYIHSLYFNELNHKCFVVFFQVWMCFICSKFVLFYPILCFRLPYMRSKSLVSRWSSVPNLSSCPRIKHIECLFYDIHSGIFRMTDVFILFHVKTKQLINHIQIA